MYKDVFPHVSPRNASSWITCSVILFEKQSKSVVPTLCQTTEQLVSDILNVFEYLPHTHRNILTEQEALFITEMLGDPIYKKSLTALNIYNSLQEISSFPNTKTQKLRALKHLRKLKKPSLPNNYDDVYNII